MPSAHKISSSVRNMELSESQSRIDAEICKSLTKLHLVPCPPSITIRGTLLSPEEMRPAVTPGSPICVLYYFGLIYFKCLVKSDTVLRGLTRCFQGLLRMLGEKWRATEECSLFSNSILKNASGSQNISFRLKYGTSKGILEPNRCGEMDVYLIKLHLIPEPTKHNNSWHAIVPQGNEICGYSGLSILSTELLWVDLL
ncbi:hypothetical protein CDAR_540421 [Caerostris darwini]|uniref:Uncharacterized protein n=1 Tax=Caerostris darwini TaxID=1538125 RepID=A0AAV4WTC0_9ARAC|nr:hypothetical protein CDAR_540421 [Caerostris darwini]